MCNNSVYCASFLLLWENVTEKIHLKQRERLHFTVSVPGWLTPAVWCLRQDSGADPGQGKLPARKRVGERERGRGRGREKQESEKGQGEG